MAGGVGNNKFAFGRGKVAIGHVDGDALFSFSAQAVGEQREIHISVTPLAAGPLHCFQLIFKNGFAIIQQAANQGTFAVIHTASGGKAQHVHCQVGVTCHVQVRLGAQFSFSSSQISNLTIDIRLRTHLFLNHCVLSSSLIDG